MSGHPLQRYAEAIEASGARRLQELTQSDPDCAVVGMVTGLRPLKTKRGDRMCVFMLEDDAAKVEGAPATGGDRHVDGVGAAAQHGGVVDRGQSNAHN